MRKRQELGDPATTDWTKCTGVSASWCPIHGDCTCPRHTVKDWDDADLHPELIASQGEDENCPLHGVLSNHAEPQFFQTIWGLVPINEEW
jgi:hypothetical protein